MIFVNVDEPIRDVWDTGCDRPGFGLMPGSRVWLEGARGDIWEVVTQLRDVVLIRRVTR